MKSHYVVRLPGAGLVGLFLLATEVLLAIRGILHFFAVNPHNGFAQWIFNSTDGIVTPFRGVFTQTVTGHPHYFDLVTLFVMVAYMVVAVLLAALLGLLHEHTLPQTVTPRKR